MGLCSSSNIELNPLAKQDVAEKLGVDVNEIVSHNIVCTIFLTRMSCMIYIIKSGRSHCFSSCVSFCFLSCNILLNIYDLGFC